MSVLVFGRWTPTDYRPVDITDAWLTYETTYKNRELRVETVAQLENVFGPTRDIF